MQMRKPCAILTIMLCICFAANGTIQAKTLDIRTDHIGERFHTQDGVIYWIGNAEAVVVAFQKGAENITIRGTVEGLSVRCEWIVWKDGLARTIVVEEGVQGLSYIYLHSFPALETVDIHADVVFTPIRFADDYHVRLIDCNNLAAFHLRNNIGEVEAHYDIETSPNAIFMENGAETVEAVMDPYAQAGHVGEDLTGQKGEVINPNDAAINEDVTIWFDPWYDSGKENTMNLRTIMFGQDAAYHVGEIDSDYWSYRAIEAFNRWNQYGRLKTKTVTRYCVDEKNKTLLEQNGLLYTKDGKELLCVPAGIEGTLVLPDGTEQIHPLAFGGCDRIETLVLPQSMQVPTSVGALFGLSELVAFQVHSDNKQMQDIDGVLFTADGETLVARPPKHGDFYMIPSGTRYVAPFAFLLNDTLQTVQMPRSVVSIGTFAFFKNTALSHIALSPAIEEIGDFAFENCHRLERLVLPPRLAHVGRLAGFEELMDMLWHSESLREAELKPIEIWIPSTIQTFHTYAFTSYEVGFGHSRRPSEIKLVVENGSPGHAYAIENCIPYCFPDQITALRQGVQYAILIGQDGEQITVYDAPDGQAGEKRYAEGTAFLLLEELDAFYMGQIGDVYAYIPKEACRIEPELRITWSFSMEFELTEPVDVYNEPTRSYEKSRTLPPNTEISVFSTFGPWSGLVMDGKEYYALTRDLERSLIVDGSDYASNARIQLPSISAQLPVYAEPDESSTIVKMLNDGAGIHAYWATLDGWLCYSNGFIRIDDAGITMP